MAKFEDLYGNPMDINLVATQTTDGLLSSADKIKLDNMYHHNLLINGDFKVWQRGESATFNTNENGFISADMIHVSLSNRGEPCTISKINGGGLHYITTSQISGSNRYLGHVSTKELSDRLNGKQVTLSLKIKKIGNSNLTLTVYKSNSDYEQISINSEEEKIYTFTFEYQRDAGAFIYNIDSHGSPQGSGFDLFYADLHEGSIIYNHIEEDDAIAFLRCREMIRDYELTITDYSYINSNVLYYIIPNGLGKNIRLEVITFDVQNHGMTGQGFTFNGISILDKDSITIEAYKPNHGIGTDLIKYPLRIHYIVTKEPLS